MKFKTIILYLVLLFISPVYSGDIKNSAGIDTARFSLKKSADSFLLIDNLEKDSTAFKRNLIIDPEIEKEEEYAYVSSYNFLEEINSFEIGNRLIGLQLSSFETMKSGSAAAAAGRDVFLMYDAKKNIVYDQLLEFGITKYRQRYIGCLSAETSHFILADVDGNGLIDIGRIKEEMECKESFNSERDVDTMSGPFFVQNPVEWYVYKNSKWSKDSSYIKIDKYADLPLIEIKLNPIDFFGYLKWGSYDPLKWERKTNVSFYPLYRRLLIKKKQTGIDALQLETVN